MLDHSLAVLAAQDAQQLGQCRSADDPGFLVDSQHSRDAGLHPAAVWRNLGTARLYEHALLFEPQASLASSGALVVASGSRTGRSPSDKRVVREPRFQDEVWWGQESPNHPADTRAFLATRQTAVDYLNLQPRVYVVDGWAGWDVTCRLKVRAICSSACQALMLTNMLVPASASELACFGEPGFVVYQVGGFPANKYESYMSSSTSIITSLAHREVVILGTQYAGESKKGIWTLLHVHLGVPDALFLHSGCNVGRQGDVTLFLGLSGTGKTTLSFDPQRALVGDDEHCWGSTGVFNIEGGCYAKVVGVTPDSPHGMHQALRFGAVLENVVIDPRTAEPDFTNTSITENMRASFPLSHVPFAAVPGVAGHPANLILLTCDAFGVLPPVSKLTLEQALYHFISGYTAKAAGTEVGVAAASATFSACFAGAFLLWHPIRYAALLADKLRQHHTQAWLLNTGWAGGCCGGSGQRISLQHTRAMVDAIHSGELAAADCSETPFFHLQVPTSCTGVPSTLLQPQHMWQDPAQYSSTLAHLAQLFCQNFAGLVASSCDSRSCDSRSRQLAGSRFMETVAAGGPQLDEGGLAAAAAAGGVCAVGGPSAAAVGVLGTSAGPAAVAACAAPAAYAEQAAAGALRQSLPAQEAAGAAATAALAALHTPRHLLQPEGAGDAAKGGTVAAAATDASGGRAPAPATPHQGAPAQAAAGRGCSSRNGTGTWQA